MLSPIATVVFFKLRHLAQLDGGAAASVWSHERQFPVRSRLSLNQLIHGLPAWRLLIILSSDDVMRHQMTPEKIVAEPVLQMSPTSHAEASMATRILPVCCVCGLIRDDTGSLPGRRSRVSWRLYRRIHNARSTERLLTHGYCPAGFPQAQDNMRAFFKEQRERDDDTSSSF